MPFRRRRASFRARLASQAASEKGTVALSALAVTGAAVALGGQYGRLFARRRHEPGSPDALLEVAPVAAADTVSVAVEAYASASRTETVLFNLLAGFVGAFAVVRLSTWGIRGRWWPLGNVKVGGRHIHHFVPGILVAFAGGIAALFVRDDALRERLAIPIGIGMGLTFDEAALLLELDDVYWTRQGLLSVQISFGLVAILSIAVITARMLLRAERHQEEIGAIPQGTGWYGPFNGH